MPWCSRDFSLKVEFQCRLFHSVCTAPVCNGMHQHVTHVNNPQTLAAIPLFGHRKNAAHTGRDGLGCCSPADASTSVCTLKIPKTGSHTIVWTHKNTAHTGRNGLRYSCSCRSLTQSNPNFPQGINEVTYS